MSLLSRVRLLFNANAHAALDELEDPPVMLSYAYEQQRALLLRVRQGLIEVATSKEWLRQQAARLRARVPQTEEQAQKALELGREDLARIALQRKQAALSELQNLDAQLAEVAEEERKLTLAQQQLSSRIEDFRIRKDVTTARYNAARAQTGVNEALTGVSGELAELTLALGRAEEKTERMTARASAIDALIESGALVGSFSAGDPVDRELRDLTTTKAVDEELSALKAKLASAESTAAAEQSDDRTQDNK